MGYTPQMDMWVCKMVHRYPIPTNITCLTCLFNPTNNTIKKNVPQTWWCRQQVANKAAVFIHKFDDESGVAESLLINNQSRTSNHHSLEPKCAAGSQRCLLVGGWSRFQKLSAQQLSSVQWMMNSIMCRYALTTSKCTDFEIYEHLRLPLGRCVWPVWPFKRTESNLFH